MPRELIDLPAEFAQQRRQFRRICSFDAGHERPEALMFSQPALHQLSGRSALARQQSALLQQPVRVLQLQIRTIFMIWDADLGRVSTRFSQTD